MQTVQPSLSRLSALATAVLLFLCGTPAQAQNQDSFYRGINATRYKFSFNGNPYWFYPSSPEGRIFYDGKLYTGLSVNINAYEQEPEILRKSDSLPIAIDGDKVPYIEIGDSLYINLRYGGINADKGFYQVLATGKDMLLMQLRKELRHNSENANGETIGYYDRRFNENILTCFAYTPTYWILKDGTMNRIRRKKDLYELYPLRKNELRNAVRGWRNKNVRGWCGAAMTVLSEGHTDPLALVLKKDFSQRQPDSESTPYTDNLPLSPISTMDILTALPEDFFENDEEIGGVVQYVSGATVTAIYQNKLYELGDKTRSGGSALKTIRGTVVNSSTGDPVPYAVIVDNATSSYAHSDRQGRYTIKLPKGENVLSFSEPTMDDLNIMVSVYDDASMDAMMNEKTITLNSAYITADSRASHRIIKMGLEKLMMRTLKKVPTAFGEADVLKAVQSLPGVQSTGEASGGINVRGGSTDQNLILYNENTIYNPSHLFGIFSTFNPNLVDGLELYKSTIPVEYGGRISSVLDVKGREGNMKKFSGAVGIGVLTSHGFIEAPLKKDTTSIVLGGRTTYSDWILGLLPANSAYSNGTAAFHDANFGITHKFRSDNVLKADVYWSKDRFGFSADTTFRYSNLNASVRWNAPVGKNSLLNVAAGYDHYENSLDDAGSDYYEYRLETGVNQAFLRAGIRTAVGKKHSLTYGLEAIGYDLRRGTMTPLCDTSLVIEHSIGSEYAIQPSVYAGDVWEVSSRFSLEYGVRGTSFYSPASKKFYFNPDIRVSAKYTVGTDLSFKAGFSSTSQYIHLISNTSSISPMDTWKLCDADIEPQTGWQTGGGIYYTGMDGMLDFSVEGYYKGIDNYLDYKSGAQLVMNENLAEDLVQTRGKAYGVELMAKKTYGKLTGWLSYTYSRTLLQEKGERGLSTINRGEWYSAPFDKPHDFKLAANYALTHRYSFSANINYSTGRPVTTPIGKYLYGNAWRLAYSDRNAYRIPDYFRLDLALNIEPSHYLKQLTYFSVTLGVYNVTGRHNAYSVFYRMEGLNTKGYMLSVFAVPIPYLTINMKF